MKGERGDLTPPFMPMMSAGSLNPALGGFLKLKGT